jgi:hypothetical protein
MHLVSYLYEDYHDARSLEHKTEVIVKNLSGATLSYHKSQIRESNRDLHVISVCI